MSMLLKEVVEFSEQWAYELGITEYDPDTWAGYLEECEDEGGLPKVYAGMIRQLSEGGFLTMH